MTHRHNLQAVDRTLGNLRRSNISFKRPVLLWIGDLQQIPPVVKVDSRSQKCSVCFKRFWLYSSFNCLQLKDNMRLHSLPKSPHAILDLLHFSAYLF